MKLIVNNQDKVIIVNATKWNSDHFAFFMALGRAVAKWVDTTSFGKKCFEDFDNKITLTDLSQYVPQCFINNDQLAKYLKEEGIQYFTIKIYSGEPIIATWTDCDLYTWWKN